MLFITHDLGVVAKICRSVSVLHAGRVLEEGETADVLMRPRHAYTRALLGSDAAGRPAGGDAAAGAAGADRESVVGSAQARPSGHSGAGMSDILLRTGSLRFGYPQA